MAGKMRLPNTLANIMTRLRARSYHHLVTARTHAHYEFDGPGKIHKPGQPNEKPSRYTESSATTVASAVANRVASHPFQQARRSEHSFSTHFILPATLKSENPCRLTACVTRWWVGRDNAALTEPTSSRANCLKTRRLPPVGCTLC